MIFTLSAQLIDMLLIKTSVYALEKSAGTAWWVGSSMYHWYNPPKPELTETEILRNEVEELKYELQTIKNGQAEEKIITLE
jgi:hypothetical protein